MNFTGKLTHSKIVAILILALVLSPLSAFAESHSGLEPIDLLPQYNNFKWIYHGSVEYGHDMEIESIVVDQNTKHYFIKGAVHDMSDGESDKDFTLDLEYIVHSDVIIQTKIEEVMLDSEYDEIELIRTPLEEGTTWNQEVENSEGATTLESTITDIEDTEEGMIFTVRYEDTNSDYYEQRKIREGTGVISVEKLMFFEEDSYPMGYSLYEEGTGYDIPMDLSDIYAKAWYYDYVTKLVTLGLIQGYPDQTFRPDGEITVAEFLKVTVISLSYKPAAGSGSWFDPYVSKAIEHGLIQEDEFEDYNRPITREEMTKIIVNAIGEETHSGQLSFADADEIEDEYVPFIYTAVQLGIIKGYPDNTFRSNRTSTRAEASKLFVILVEQMIQTEDFTEDDALALEAEFENRLYQETESDSWVVVDFDSKESLVEHISEIADRELAETYVDNYYDYMDGELVLPPKDGITTIIEDRDYQLEMIHPREYQMTQETTTEMVGHYTLTVTYHYENEAWIMKDRDLEVHEIN
ncbi:MAG: S-layer homology domain-containing protein [Bacillota bacterium]